MKRLKTSDKLKSIKNWKDKFKANKLCTYVVNM